MPHLIAHRGVHRHPGEENTLIAFAEAAHRMDGFECDVRFSSDGVPVVCHDETLTRTHGEEVLVSSLTAAGLRARSRGASFSPTRVVSDASTCFYPRRASQVVSSEPRPQTLPPAPRTAVPHEKI